MEQKKMNYIEYNAIKKLNIDYLNIYNSDEYKFGETLYRFFYEIKKGHLGKAKKILMEKVISLRIRKFSKKKICEIKEYSHDKNERIAVYTVIFGKYDNLKEPFIQDPMCDYYIITDEEVPESSVWHPVSKDVLDLTKDSDLFKRNRFYKMNPFLLFPNYRYVIYIDGWIEIMGYPSALIKYINPKTGLAIHNLSCRDCIYDEEKSCALRKQGNAKKIHNQTKKYSKEGFPKHFGVYECPVIVSDNSSNMCKKILKNWWQEFCKGGNRDQISLPYLVWKEGLEYEDIGILGNDVRRNPMFRTHPHNKNKK